MGLLLRRPGFLSWLKELLHLERKPLSTWSEVTGRHREVRELQRGCWQQPHGDMKRLDAIESAGGEGWCWNRIGPETWFRDPFPTSFWFFPRAGSAVTKSDTWLNMTKHTKYDQCILEFESLTMNRDHSNLLLVPWTLLCHFCDFHTCAPAGIAVSDPGVWPRVRGLPQCLIVQTTQQQTCGLRKTQG